MYFQASQTPQAKNRTIIKEENSRFASLTELFIQNQCKNRSGSQDVQRDGIWKQIASPLTNRSYSVFSVIVHRTKLTEQTAQHHVKCSLKSPTA